MRRTWLSLALLAGCFEESSPPGDDDGTTATSGPAATSDDPTTTAASTDATSAAATSADATSADVTSVDATSASTGEPPGSCEWPLEWEATPNKDVLILVDAMPTNLGALLQAAQNLSGDGVHVAVGSRCDEDQGVCGVEGDTYEHHGITDDSDPLEQAADFVAQVTNLRPFVPRHLYVLAALDTTWTPMDLVAEPELAGAHVHVRFSGGPCGGAPQLQALAQASGGSIVCEDFSGNDVLGAEVMMPQPACELFGDPSMGPTPEMPATEMTLQGDTSGGTEAIVLGAPAPCGNQPGGWTIIDGPLGHMGLCPIACRDAGLWAPPSLTATVTFACE